MTWWGMILGGAFGYMLGGPLGAVLGAALGRSFGRAAASADADYRDGRMGGGIPHERAQLAFFTATFGVMGHVAKADGQVSREEIGIANEMMRELGLDEMQREAAREIFNEGKEPDFPLDDVLEQLRSECRRSSNLLRMFMELQVQAACADGEMDARERELLRYIAARLRISEREFAEIERLVTAGMHGRQEQRRGGGPSLEDAYATLGVSPDTPDDEVRRAYRRLMNRHHPDKLQAKGLPEQMMRAATERTQQIKAAWDRVKAERAKTDSRRAA